MLSVTQALKIAGVVDTEFMTQHGAARGTAVHAAIEMDIAGELDESSVHDEVRPYLESWRKWRAFMGDRLVILDAEFAVTDRYGRYIGHPDLLCEIDEKRYVIDFKCGPKMAWHRLQTQLYVDAIVGDNEKPIRVGRAALYLSSTGGMPKLDEHEFSRADENAARGAVNLATWIAANMPERIES